jgi:regulator of replication initiation timing
MNLVNEISSIESELESLRAECKMLREAKLILEFENDQLKRRLAAVEEQRDGHLAGKVRLKTLLDQAGQHLVSGINRYNDEMRAAIGSGGAAEEPRLIERAAE